MKYSKSERLDIGRQIYDGEISKRQAASKYGISDDTARGYMREYRDFNKLPPREPTTVPDTHLVKVPNPDPDLADYENMTRAELIDALVIARINVARLKKGYEVKGVGAKKKYIRLGSKNTK